MKFKVSQWQTIGIWNFWENVVKSVHSWLFSQTLKSVHSWLPPRFSDVVCDWVWSQNLLVVFEIDFTSRLCSKLPSSSPSEQLLGLYSTLGFQFILPTCSKLTVSSLASMIMFRTDCQLSGLCSSEHNPEARWAGSQLWTLSYRGGWAGSQFWT